MNDETGRERTHRMDRLGMTDAEVEARLRAYADARLSPSEDWSAATRAQLVALAERQADAQARESLAHRQRRARAERSPLFAGFRRRAAAGLIAAALTIGSVGAVLAADPSSALYPARLFLESVTLPSGNASAELDRLDRRISDAQAAAQRGHGSGVSAALAAYRQTLLDALKAAGDDPERLARLNAALGVHAVVLTELQKTAPDNAGQAVKDALDANKDARDAAGKPSTSPEPKPTPKR